MFAGLIVANLAAWAWAWALFGHAHALLGAALLAYLFGVRHAFDADHIAAIDNVVRRLTQDGRPAASVGLFFALGHSSVVAAAAVGVAVLAAATRHRLAGLHDAVALTGALVSTGFLLAIGLANIALLGRLWSRFRRLRRGDRAAQADGHAHAALGGPLARRLRPAFRAVSRPWRMFPIGLLFGLGFDTASEVSLLALTATQAAHGAPVWTILVFPALFAAGMALVDTADSALMSGAYRWASAEPLRRLWCDITITAGSVAVALFVGGVEALGLIAQRLRLTGGLWDLIDGLNRNLTGFGVLVIGVFLLSWAISVVLYRLTPLGRPIAT